MALLKLRESLKRELPECQVSFEAGDIVTQVMSFGSPTPIEVAEDAERWCKKYDWGGKASRPGVEEQLKLQYYYGGQAIYLLRSPEGPVVLPIPERYRNTPDLR